MKYDYDTTHFGNFTLLVFKFIDQNNFAHRSYTIKRKLILLGKGKIDHSSLSYPLFSLKATEKRANICCSPFAAKRAYQKQKKRKKEQKKKQKFCIY